MTQRVLILTEIIAPYRIPVFNALAQRQDIDLHVVFLSETDRSLRDWQVYKDEIRFSYEVLPSFRRRIGKYNLLLNAGVGRALRRAKPNCILCGGYNYVASWQAARWARRQQVPFMMWVESNAFDQRRHYFPVEYLKKKMLGLGDAYVVPGRMSREYLESLGVSANQIFVAPNAVDNEYFAHAENSVRENISDHRKRLALPEHYFLFVGRLVLAKGVFDLLDAYAALPAEIRSQFGLVFAGSGNAEEELRKRAQEISPGTVLFPGFAQREQLAIFYSLADILVFPTHSDTWGLVVNEAMACGLPVICSTVAGCSADLVEHGANGCIVSPGDVPQLASAMESLARDPQLRSQMRMRSLQRISNFSPAAWAGGVAAAVQCVTGVAHD
jgi:glycosyltransferase involved in cell wall biosynthesis